MKTSIFVIVSLLLAISSIAQISPFLKIGGSYPGLVYNDESIPPDYHTLKVYPSVSVEKPIPVKINLKNRLSINPGLDYYFFKQSLYDVFDDVSGIKDYRYNRHAINGYVKMLFQFKPVYNREGFIYFGGSGGIRVFTHTNGVKETYGLNDETPYITEDVKGNAKDFFNPFYYGAVAGWQPHFKKYKMVKFGFEFGYYPGFLSIYMEESEDMVSKIAIHENIDLWQFSMYLGLRRR